MPSTVEVKRFEDAEGEWEEILPSCFTNTVFVTPWWQKTWYLHFGGNADLHILTPREEGETLGIAPLMLRDGVLTFVGDTDLCDYADFLVPAANAEVFYPTLFDSIRDMDWHTIDLRSIPEDSPTLSHLPRIASSAGYECAILKEGTAPVASLPQTWDEYVAALPKKHRHELRRKLRRLGEAGTARQYVCDDPETVGRCMQDFFRLHRASSEEKAEFMTLERERFFSDIAVVLSARDQFKLAFLELEGIRVASCISFDYLDSDLLYNSGYDPTYSKLSVGLINKALAVKEAIEEGKRYFDFLRGTERYKYDLGAEDRAVFTLILRR